MTNFPKLTCYAKSIQLPVLFFFFFLNYKVNFFIGFFLVYIVDFGESDKMIKISGKVDKSDT